MNTTPLVVISLALTSLAAAYPDSTGKKNTREPLDWRVLESGILSRQTQLTTRDRYIKAGEAYFNPEGTWIIFQAVPVPPAGEEPNPNYEMYVAPLERDSEGHVTGLGEAIMLSKPGSANTCGWWHPTEPGLVMFGTTTVPPRAENQPGYQRESGKYTWSFPVEMEIVTTRIDGDSFGPVEPMFERPGYDAEASWSPDGRHVLYANVDMEKSQSLGRPDADLWVFDTETGEHTLIVEASGYDGGPFFGPDGKWITYRSDRRGDNMLQLFIAELDYDDAGRIVGIKREVQLTDNEHVNWAPFWHPSGRYLVYASSIISHRNYEVFAIPALDADGQPVTDGEPIRITSADTFDGLPVFSPDGSLMMWTSQRGPKIEGESRPSSQVWIAEFKDPMMPVCPMGE